MQFEYYISKKKFSFNVFTNIGWYPSHVPLLHLGWWILSIGKVHKQKEEYDAAMDCFSSSLFIKRAKFGTTHLSIAETLHQMASIYDDEAK